MADRKQFTKDGSPRDWKGMKQKLTELESKVKDMERNETLIKESYAKEMDRLRNENERLSQHIADHIKTIKAQGEHITKAEADKLAFEAEMKYLRQKLEATMNRSLFERLFNVEAEV